MSNSCKVFAPTQSPVQLRLAGLTAGMAVAAAIGQILYLDHMPPLGAWVLLPGWALMLLFLCTESFTVELPVGSSAVTVSLSEIPMVFGLAFVSPITLVMARVAGGGIAWALRRRTFGWAFVFNLALFWLEAVVLVAVYRFILGNNDPRLALGLEAVFAATLIASQLSLALSLIGLTVAGEQVRVRLRDWAYLTTQLVTVVSTALATLGLVATQVQIESSGLLLVLAGVLFLALREYGASRMRKEGFLRLRSFTRALRGGVSEADLERLLQEVRTTFQARRAEITLFETEHGHQFTRLIMDSTGRLHKTANEGDHKGALSRLNLARLSEARLAKAGDLAAAGERPWLAGMREAIAAPLRAGGREIGVLIAYDHRNPERGFVELDRQRFDIFTGFLGPALQSAQLGKRLRLEIIQRDYQSLHDPETQLPNQEMLMRRLGESITNADRDKDSVGLVVLEIDDLADALGGLGRDGAAGLLNETVARLQAVAGQGLGLYRIRFDRFAALIPGAVQVQMEELTRALLMALTPVITVGGATVGLAGRAGIAIFPNGGLQPKALLEHAEIALDHGRRHRQPVVVYDPEQSLGRHRYVQVVGELQRAIAEDQLVLYYQPWVSLNDGRVRGLEALVRWDHPRLGLLTPDMFVPLAERAGIVRLLTRWVLGKLFDQHRALERAGHSLSLSINLSAADLKDKGLADYLRSAATVVGTDPGAIVLEFRESAIPPERDAAALALGRLSAAGFRIALDNFGAGFSSLAVLKELPIDMIKIDQAFVDQVVTNARDGAVARSIAQLAHNLGAVVLGHGVETWQQWAWLKGLGYDHVQGYLVARPMPGHELLQRIDTLDVEPPDDAAPEAAAPSGA